MRICWLPAFFFPHPVSKSHLLRSFDTGLKIFFFCFCTENQWFPGPEERDSIVAHHCATEHVLSGLCGSKPGTGVSCPETEREADYFRDR